MVRFAASVVMTQSEIVVAGNCRDVSICTFGSFRLFKRGFCHGYATEQQRQ
jgi:hypothetical protein